MSTQVLLHEPGGLRESCWMTPSTELVNLSKKCGYKSAQSFGELHREEIGSRVIRIFGKSEGTPERQQTLLCPGGATVQHYGVCCAVAFEPNTDTIVPLRLKDWMREDDPPAATQDKKRVAAKPKKSLSSMGKLKHELARMTEQSALCEHRNELELEEYI